MINAVHDSTNKAWVPPGHTRFLRVFETYVDAREWITARQLAHRLFPVAGKQSAKIEAVCRDLAIKLSNLNRFGHLDRREIKDRSADDGRTVFEYAIPTRRSNKKGED